MPPAELFQIPYKDKFIIYAPLKCTAFIGNKALALLVMNMLHGKRPDKPNTSETRAMKFIDSTGILAPEPGPHGAPAERTYKPACTTLFLTNRCNLRCQYCYASSGDYVPMDMAPETATQAIDIACQNALELGHENFELVLHGGGEPTQNWKLLTMVVAYAREKPLPVNIGMSSNGYYSKSQLDFILKNLNWVNLSYDGPPDVQDLQRPLKSGKPTSGIVMRTIKLMDERSYPYKVRMTVTSRSVKDLPRMIAFVSENAGTRLIQVEPAIAAGRGKDQAIKDLDRFIEAFQEAYDLAASRGIELIYSGARLESLNTQFCGVACNNMVVLENGKLTPCYEVHNLHHPLAPEVVFGEIRDGRLSIDEKLWKKTSCRNVAEIPHCADCFCKYHCAGDCLGQSFHPGKKGYYKPSPRCKVNRELTKFLLIKKLIENKGLWTNNPQFCQ